MKGTAEGRVSFEKGVEEEELPARMILELGHHIHESRFVHHPDEQLHRLLLVKLHQLQYLCPKGQTHSPELANSEDLILDVVVKVVCGNEIEEFRVAEFEVDVERLFILPVVLVQFRKNL